MRSNSNTYGYTNGITDGNSNAERNCDVYSYPHTDTNGYFNSDLNRDSNANCNRYGYIHANANAYGHCHSNSDLHAYGYSYGHTNSGTNTCGSDSAKRKPRDCQQLHRELERCKRRDWLPVGCVNEQLFCQFCARLRKFGRPQHNESKRDRIGRQYVLLLPVTRLQWQRHRPQFQRHQGKDQAPLIRSDNLSKAG
jgi:hypothetical protein